MKKLNVLLISIISLFLFIPGVSAVETIERNNSNNYGVNKKIKITDQNLDNILATPYVKNSDQNIYDFGNVLTDEEEKNLASRAKGLQIELGFDVVVYIISDDTAYNLENEDSLAADFFDYNDFGIDTEFYDGVMLLINKPSPRFDSPYPIYFNVRSFGKAQFYYDYDRCEEILDGIENDLYDYNFYSGIESFFEEARTMFRRGSWDVDGNWYLDETGTLVERKVFPFGIILISSLVITVIIVIALIKKNKMVMKAEDARQYIKNGGGTFTRRDDVFRRSATTHVRISSDSSSGGRSSSGSFRGSSGRSSSGGGGRRR